MGKWEFLNIGCIPWELNTETNMANSIWPHSIQSWLFNKTYWFLERKEMTIIFYKVCPKSLHFTHLLT